MKTCKICKRQYDEKEHYIIKEDVTFTGEYDDDGFEIIEHKDVKVYPFKKYCLPCSVNKNTKWRIFTQIMWVLSIISSIVLWIVFILLGIFFL